MTCPIYCFDTSSLLEAWTRTYPIDIFSKFWIDLQGLIDEGIAVAPEEVRTELSKKEDDIAEWSKNQSNFFVPFDPEQEQHLITVMSDHELLVKSTKRKNAADPFVIALAKAKGTIVVSEERPGSVDRPKIPDVCRSMGIDYLSVLEMIRKQKWTY